MSIINIDNMYREIKDAMQNNFTGTPEERYKQAKELFLSSVSETIETNKDELLKEIKEE